MWDTFEDSVAKAMDAVPGVPVAIELNSYVLNKMNDKINSLPHKDIIEAYYDPENNRGQ